MEGRSPCVQPRAAVVVVIVNLAAAAAAVLLNGCGRRTMQR